MLAIFARLCAVFLMIGLGWLARRRQVLDGDSTHRLSRLLAGFIFPCLIFSSIVRQFQLADLPEKWPLPAGAFGILAIGYGAGHVLQPLLGGRRSREARTFHLQMTMNNYSFLPLPLALFYWGEAGVANLVVAAIGGQLAAWSFGVHTLSPSHFSAESLRRLVNPPLVAMLLALAVVTLRDTTGLQAFFARTEDGDTGTIRMLMRALLDGLAIFGAATTPVAMVVGGSRMAELKFRQVFRRRLLGLAAGRLLLVPALALFCIWLLPLSTDATRILALIAVMPVAVSTVMISDMYGGDTDFAAAGVLLTHLFCLLTIPVWLSLMLGL